MMSGAGIGAFTEHKEGSEEAVVIWGCCWEKVYKGDFELHVEGELV